MPTGNDKVHWPWELGVRDSKYFLQNCQDFADDLRVVLFSAVVVGKGRKTVGQQTPRFSVGVQIQELKLLVKTIYLQSTLFPEHVVRVPAN